MRHNGRIYKYRIHKQLKKLIKKKLKNDRIYKNRQNLQK